jgi:hypothetical protein
MIFQKGMKLRFETGGDFTRVVRVQIAPSGDDTRMPSILLDGGSSARKVQVVSGGDQTRIPKVQIPGLAAWFKFNTGITVTGAGVSQWDDMSGNGRHLKQGTDTNRPALQVDGTILFDGSDNFLKCDAFTLNRPETIYFLGKQVTYTNTDYIFDGDGADSGSLAQIGTTPTIRAFAGAGITNDDFTADTYAVVTTIFDGFTSVLQVNHGTAVTGDTSAAQMSGFTLGAAGTAVNHSNIRVKEVLIFNTAHDAAMRRRIVSYLLGI